MSDSTKTIQSSFPVTGVLGVAFVVLKLCGVIDWSWLWVTAPFWAPWVLMLIGVFLFVVVPILFMVLVDLSLWLPNLVWGKIKNRK